MDNQRMRQAESRREFPLLIQLASDTVVEPTAHKATISVEPLQRNLKDWE